MKLTLMPPGRPGEDLGVSHMLKHWLNPAELWQDIADGVPDDVQPHAMHEQLPRTHTPVWLAPTRPDGTIHGRWRQLRDAYARGYGALLIRMAAPLADPDGPDWVRRGGGVRQAVPPEDGVVLRVRKTHQRWQLYSAFRPVIAQFADLYHPPRDPQNVSMRRKLQALKALRMHYAIQG